jgi:NADH-ubiquinone oxidoreductase chain 2
VIIFLILLVLLSVAVVVRRDISIYYSRASMISLGHSSDMGVSSLYVNSLSRGIPLFNGTFNTTAITQTFHVFIFVVSALILQLTAFHPRKV